MSDTDAQAKHGNHGEQEQWLVVGVLASSSLLASCLLVGMRVLCIPRLVAALPELLLLPIVFTFLPVFCSEGVLLVLAVVVPLVLIEVIVFAIVLLRSLPVLVRPLVSFCPFLVAVCLLLMGSVELATGRILGRPVAGAGHVVVFLCLVAGEDVVGSRDLFKLFLILGCALCGVRMVLLGEVVVDPLDVCGRGVVSYTELGVIIDVF